MKTIYPKIKNLFLLVTGVFISLLTCYVSNAQSVGVNVASPAAQLHIGASSGATGTAPLKLTDGTLISVTDVSNGLNTGAIEYSGHTFYATTYKVRRSIMLAQDVIITPVVVTNTTVETTIYTATMAQNYLTAGKMIHIKLFGKYSSNASSTFVITVYLNATLIHTSSTSVAGTSAGSPIEIDFNAVIRSVGASGTIISLSKMQQDNIAPNLTESALTTINTTGGPNSIFIKVKWSAANAADIFTIDGGATECVDPNN